jgi:hypothetical protein
MESLSLATVRTLMLAVERIHSVTAPADFGSEIFAAIADVLPAGRLRVRLRAMPAYKADRWGPISVVLESRNR